MVIYNVPSKLVFCCSGHFFSQTMVSVHIPEVLASSKFLNTSFYHYSSPPQSHPFVGPSAQNVPPVLALSMPTHPAKPRSNGTTHNIFRAQSKSANGGSHATERRQTSQTPCSSTWECCGIRATTHGFLLVAKTSSPFFPHPSFLCTLWKDCEQPSVYIKVCVCSHQCKQSLPPQFPTQET